VEDTNIHSHNGLQNSPFLSESIPHKLEFEISKLKQHVTFESHRLEGSLFDKIEQSLDKRSVGGEGYSL
jgi:hypothetical protein